jgi:hypothetical protein
MDNITMTILDILHTIFHLNREVSETGLCHRLHVTPTHLGPIDRASTYFRRNELAPFIGPICVISTKT